MAAARLLLGLAAAVVVHALGVRWIPGFARVVDVFLLVTVLHGLGGRSLAGIGGGLAAGLTHDALTGGPFGLHGFADTLVGYVAARLAQRLVIERASGVTLVVAGLDLVQQLLLLLVHALAAPPVPWPDPRWVVLEALTCGVLGGMLFLSRGLWRRGRSARKRRRTRRLRLD